MRSTSGPITSPKWRHDPTVANVSQWASNNLAIPDEYLTGHARRVGLAGEKTPKETLERLLPTIRADMVHESDELRDANFDGHFRIRETESIEANAAALAQFLAATPEKAYEIANIDYLFAD